MGENNNEENTEVAGDMKLTSVNVTAASPAVMERICKEVCDEVMKQIPDDTIENIAKEVLESGRVLALKPRHSTSYDKTTMSDIVQHGLADQVKNQVEELLKTFMAQPEAKEAIIDIAADTFAKCVEQVPRYLAHKFFGSLSSYTPDFSMEVISQIQFTKMDLDMLKDTLRNNTTLDIM